MEWKVYILRCGDNSLYTGITKDVEQRIDKHRTGKGSKYVRSRLPVNLVFKEKGYTHSSALRREHEIKSMSKKQKEELIDEA